MDQNIYVTISVALAFDYESIDELMNICDPDVLKPVESLDDLAKGTILIIRNSEQTYHINKVGEHYTGIITLKELARFTEDKKAPKGFKAFNEGRIILSKDHKPQLIVGIDDIRRWANEPTLYEHRILLDKQLQTNINAVYDAAKKKHAELIARYGLVINDNSN